MTSRGGDLPLARRAVRLLLYPIAILSYGGFNPALFGQPVVTVAGADDGASLQQYLVVAGWGLLLALSFMRGALAAPLRTQGLFWPALFLGYVVASPIWSDDPVAAAPKAVVFLIVSVGVWRLASILSVEDMIEILIRSLAVLMVASALALIIDPQNAIAHDFYRSPTDIQDLWQGIYAQKQGLGMVGADFVFLTLMRTLHRRSMISFFGCVLGLVLVIGSGSHGGAVAALLVPVAILAGRRYPRLLPAVLSAIIFEVVLVLGVIVYLTVTGEDHFDIMGNDIDITGRAIIWQYSLALWWQSKPLLGYGLNGFWTIPDILWGFLRVHGWVLDNYHDGYIAILVETGIVGLAIFLCMVSSLYSRLRILVRFDYNSEATQIVLGLLIMGFTINLTETIFLRSTNFGQVLFSFWLINIFSAPRLLLGGAVAGRVPKWRSGYA